MHPDVTLTNLCLPELGSSDVMQRIRSRHPAAKVILRNTFATGVQALRTLRAGATSHLLKSALRTELLFAIRAPFAKERPIRQDIVDNISENLMEDALREREVEETVRAHHNLIFCKFGAEDRTQAVVFALRRETFPLSEQESRGSACSVCQTALSHIKSPTSSKAKKQR